MIILLDIKINFGNVCFKKNSGKCYGGINFIAIYKYKKILNYKYL